MARAAVAQSAPVEQREILSFTLECSQPLGLRLCSGFKSASSRRRNGPEGEDPGRGASSVVVPGAEECKLHSERLGQQQDSRPALGHGIRSCLALVRPQGLCPACHAAVHSFDMAGRAPPPISGTNPGRCFGLKPSVVVAHPVPQLKVRAADLQRSGLSPNTPFKLVNAEAPACPAPVAEHFPPEKVGSLMTTSASKSSGIRNGATSKSGGRPSPLQAASAQHAAR